MPRVTYATYLERRALLVNEHNQRAARAFIVLTLNQQWDLYGYFRSHRQLSNLELKDHYQALAQQHSSLPQRAGKAFKQIEPWLCNTVTPETIRPKQPSHAKAGAIRVYPLVRPDIDYKKLARVCVEIARMQRKSLGVLKGDIES